MILVILINIINLEKTQLNFKMGNLACIISYINMYVHITCICKDLVE